MLVGSNLHRTAYGWKHCTKPEPEILNVDVTRNFINF